MTASRLVIAGSVVAAGLALAFWLMSRQAGPPVGPPDDSVADMPDMDKPRPGAGLGSRGMEVPEEAGPSAPETGIVTIAPERLQTIGVKYEQAARRPMQKGIRTVGRVALDERRLAKVTIKFHGWIEKLLVSAVGDRVRKGQVLFTIYSPDLVATQEEYLLALRGRRELGESQLSEAARGAKDLLEATRHRLHLWDISPEHIQELEQTGQVVRTLPIHSPITGTVVGKEIVQGTHVEPGQELYTIADLSHVWIMADVYEYELSFVKQGQKARVTLSYEPGSVMAAVVGFVYPTLDPKTRTARVRFELDNPGEKLKPDMYTNVELIVNLGTRLVIPKEAVIESGQKQLVFIHHGGGRLEPRLIKTGMKGEEYLEVLEGVREGDHVVTSANFLVDSESRLKSAVESMGGMGMK